MEMYVYGSELIGSQNATINLLEILNLVYCANGSTIFATGFVKKMG